MKKFMSYFLVLTMLLTLAACKATGEQTETVNGKTKITLACTGMPFFEEKIKEFNDSNKKYYIEVLDYSQYNTKEDFSAGETKLNVDIISGNTPDMIELTKTPVEIYTGKGLLEDLNPFLQKDKDLNQDSIVAGAYNALSSNDGLYRIAPSFTVLSFYGKESKIGKRTKWNIQELQEFLEENKNVQYPFINMQPVKVLQSLTMYSLDEFMSIEDGSSNFNSAEFINLLKTVKNYGKELSEGYKEANEELMKDKGLLVEMYLSGIEEFVKKNKELGGDMNVIGFPTEGESGSVADFQSSFAMLADSQHKEGVWEFFKFLLEESYQDSLSEFEIPVLRASYDKALDKSEATEEQKQAYNRIIASITRTSWYDDSLIKIIEEEALRFFADKCTAEEAAEAIQSRASIYLSENR